MITDAESEAEKRLHEHNKELLREEFRYRAEAANARVGRAAELSITVAIMIEVIVGLLHPALSARFAILLGAGLAACTVAFLTYVRRAKAPSRRDWEEYERKLTVEFQRHQEVLRRL